MSSLASRSGTSGSRAASNSEAPTAPRAARDSGGANSHSSGNPSGSATPRAVGASRGHPRPHPPYKRVACYGCKPPKGVHLFSVPKKDRRAVAFRDNFKDD